MTVNNKDPFHKKLRFFSKAKVNLYLEILEKLNDGYHIIESLDCFPEIGDNLTFKKSKKISFKVSGEFSNDIPLDNNNLIIKASKLMLSQNEGVEVHLKKNLPVSSGIGGGSSNAAITLKALSSLFKRELPEKEKIFNLGADTHVCLNQTLQIVEGKGEIVSLFPCKEKFSIILINLLFPVSTKEIFDSFILEKKIKNKKNEFNFNKNIFSFLQNKKNDLEEVALSKYPILGSLLEDIRKLDGCLLARMSGSGGTCFGLFKNIEESQQGSLILRKKYNKAWIQFSEVNSFNS